MTIQDKIEIVKEAISKIERGRNSYMCIALHICYVDNRGIPFVIGESSLIVEKYFPELLEYQHTKNQFDAWITANLNGKMVIVNRETRILILKDLLKRYEQHLEQQSN